MTELETELLLLPGVRYDIQQWVLTGCRWRKTIILRFWLSAA